MSEISRPKPLPWYYGLVPPLWMVLQMVIMFSNPSELVTGTIWTYLWGLEALVTYVAMMWWIDRARGPKSPRYYHMLALYIAWIVGCYVLWQWINSLVPRPDYHSIGGVGEEHLRLVEAASSRFANAMLASSIGYFVVMISGVIFNIRIYGRKKPISSQLAS